MKISYLSLTSGQREFLEGDYSPEQAKQIIRDIKREQGKHPIKVKFKVQ